MAKLRVQYFSDQFAVVVKNIEMTSKQQVRGETRLILHRLSSDFYNVQVIFAAPVQTVGNTIGKKSNGVPIYLSTY